MTRFGWFFVIAQFTILLQMWILLGSPLYLDQFTINGRKVPEEDRYVFVQKFFRISDEQARNSKKYENIITMGVKYLNKNTLEYLIKRIETVLAVVVRKEIVKVLLYFHYEACQKLKLPLPILEVWNTRTRIKEEYRLEFVQKLFEYESTGSEFYISNVEKFMRKAVKYIKLEAQSRENRTAKFDIVKKELVDLLDYLCTCKYSTKPRFSMFAVYQMLNLDLTNETIKSIPSGNYMTDSNIDRGTNENISTKQGESLSPLVAECLMSVSSQDQPLASASISLEHESNQNQSYAPCEHKSLLESFNDGKLLFGQYRIDFVRNFFKPKSNYRSSHVYPYDTIIETGCKYFENDDLKEFEKGLKSMIGKQFCKEITNILLCLHHEVSQKLTIPSATLEAWNKRGTIKEEHLLKFVRKILEHELMQSETYKRRADKLVVETVKYIQLEAQSGGKMANALKTAKYKLADSLESLCCCQIPAKPKFAMFAIYRALRPDPTINYSSKLLNDEESKYEEYLSKQINHSSSNQINAIQFETQRMELAVGTGQLLSLPNTQNAIDMPLNSDTLGLYAKVLNAPGSLSNLDADYIDISREAASLTQMYRSRESQEGDFFNFLACNCNDFYVADISNPSPIQKTADDFSLTTYNAEAGRSLAFLYEPQLSEESIFTDPKSRNLAIENGSCDYAKTQSDSSLDSICGSTIFESIELPVEFRLYNL